VLPQWTTGQKRVWLVDVCICTPAIATATQNHGSDSASITYGTGRVRTGTPSGVGTQLRGARSPTLPPAPSLQRIGPKLSLESHDAQPQAHMFG
jgi:hypothetical protein